MPRFPSRVAAGLAGTAVVIAATGGLAAGQGQGKGKPKTGVTLTAKPMIVVFGSATTLSGRVSDAKAGVRVSLERDVVPYGDGFATQRETTTAASGSYSFIVTPTYATRYRAVAKTSPPATSPVANVRVRMRVGLRLSTSTPNPGSLVRFSGSVHPEHDGRIAAIQRRSPSGRWVTVARTTLRDAGTTRSAYARRVPVSSDGVYRVKVAADADHLSGFSRRRAIDVLGR